MEPWFNPLHAWIPGTLLGVTCGLVGACAGVMATGGRGRAFILNAMRLLIAASLVLLVAGIVALIQGQPYGVWYGLGLGGVIGCLVLIPNYLVVRHRYRQVELRKIDAQSLSR